MYDQYYGFSERPFQLTPDPQFYFESITHRKAMSYLGYGLAQGEGFIIITGEIGAGKTTLVAHLMATIDPQRLTAVKIVSTQVSGDDMLRLAAQSFGIPTDRVEKAHLLSRIEAFLHHQARAGRRTLLIVDEAQNLSAEALEELRMLSNFQLGGQSLLQIFLLGQPEFRARIGGSERLEQIRQRVIATHHLEPMQADEVAPYIEHRLKVVGWKGAPRFTPGAYAMLAQASGGIPRRLNALVSRVLLLGAIDHLDILDERVIEAVVADLGRDVPDLEGERDDEHQAVSTPTATSRPADASARFNAAPEAATIGATPKAVAFIADEDVHSSGQPIADVSVATRDLQILREEIQELNAAIGRSEADLQNEARLAPALEARLARVEARLDEQDDVLRRILTRLIEWVERDGEQGNLPTRAA